LLLLTNKNVYPSKILVPTRTLIPINYLLRVAFFENKRF